MNQNKTISPERLELIYESTLQQFRSGRKMERIIVNLYAKGLNEDEAEQLAQKAYYKYQDEERQSELQKSYNKPLIPLPINFFKSLFIKVISFILSMLTGHFINPKYLTKQDEKRVQ